MQTTIQKWGDSLAVRIPAHIAQELHLNQDSPVELALEEGRLTIVPIPTSALTLELLLARVSDENRHEEIFTDPPVGNEVW